MQYGSFDDAKREYVITRPDTPLPWINYLGTEGFFSLISNTGGGYSFYKDARLRRITRYRYNNAPLDGGGRYVYVRDESSREYWSPSWAPVRGELEDYRCRHGLGYTVIESKYAGIRAESRYFVPLGQSLEIWQMTVTNERQSAAALSIFAAVEFCLWDAWDDQTNFQRNLSTGEVEVEEDVIYHKTEYRERRDHFAYFACSEKAAGFDTQREAFLGSYRGWDRPVTVEGGRACNSIAFGWQPIGSFQVRLRLEPGEKKQIIFLLGYHENPRDGKFDPPGSQTLNKRTIRPVIQRFLDAANVERACEELRQYWERTLGILQVKTPEQHLDRMVNIWNAYQCVVTLNLSRSASLFESGIGRGIGFRDSNQDLLASVQMAPERARERLLDLAATQLPDGGAYHQYQPLTRRGNDDIGSNFNDDPLWLVLAAGAYLRETGDWAILDARVPYDNEAGSEAPLYEHLERTLQYTMDRLGPHGLPLIGRADWNDCLNLNCFSDTPGESFQTAANRESSVAESVFIAALFVAAAREMEEIEERHPAAGKEPAKSYAEQADEMSRAIYRHGWDGEWFLRAYDAAGRKVGSAECQEGQIYIEPQGFCALAGIGLENGMAQKALDAVHGKLLSEHGLALLQPAYSHYDPNLGEISSYPPGYKENGGIFCHNNPWVMIAEARLGNGERALDYYLRINPSRREALSEKHRCEPYVYAQLIAGPEAPTHGEAKNSWLTGTAAWNYVAVTQWILGIRPSWDGLEVAPTVPSDWKGFTVERRFRGASYHIEVKRVGPGKQVRVMLDGKACPNPIIPADPQHGSHRVEVRLGD